MPPPKPQPETLEQSRRYHAIPAEDVVGLFLAVHWPQSALYELFGVLGKPLFERILEELAGRNLKIPTRKEFEEAVFRQKVYEAVEQQRGTVLGLSKEFDMNPGLVTQIHRTLRQRTLSLVRPED